MIPCRKCEPNEYYQMMAAKTRSKSIKKSRHQKYIGITKYYAAQASYLLYRYDYFPYVASGILLVEIFLNIFIIERISYTEIDWKAYMQEVEGVINGTLDYSKLKGDTGPLVYPAGFIYIFSMLYFITDHGENIRFAQYIYMIIYLITLYLLYRIYKVCQKAPPYALILCCCTAYRIHSIYVLRMFNDPISVMLLYLSLNLFLMNKWTVGSIVYSLAVSVKMNILLYAPALLGAYIVLLGMKETAKQLIICALIQLLLAAPFLCVNPYAYVKQSFDLGRVFLYRWTVNWRFIPEDVFLNFYFHIILLSIHALLIVYCSIPMIKYFKSYAAVRQLEKDVMPQLHSRNQVVNMGSLTQLFLLPFFLSNFIGIVCSRSLHYQFYIWYYHTLPFLLWSTTFSNKVRLLLLGIIELCWNTYPSTRFSSISLFISHTAILSNLIRKFSHKIKN